MNVKRRSSKRRGRLSDSKSLLSVGPEIVGTRATVVLPAAPNRRNRLSEGALVEASIRARLLGIPLLKLDATLAVVPAETSAPSSPHPEPLSARSPRATTRHSGAAGHDLADAVRSINEGADLLAEVRRNGS